MSGGIKRILNSIRAALAAIGDRLTSKWVVIVGHSMYPTLNDGQRVLVSRRALRRKPPSRGDIAYFEHPQRDGFWEVKRIVGLPGESVSLASGRLVIDGMHVYESYLLGQQPRINRQWQLESHEYILLGDNRRWSSDSRSFGPVHRGRILGLVMLPHDEKVV